jgi:glycine cleavage system H protein
MVNLIDCLRYTKDHLWVLSKDEEAVIGLTDYAQSQLSDITYLELPQIDQTIEKGEVVMSLESVKAATEIMAPISGTIIEVHFELEQYPELINSEPYGQGWIFKIDPVDINEINNLLTVDEYRDLLDIEE